MDKSLTFRAVVSWIAYPLVMAFGIAQYLTLTAQDLPLQLSSYITVSMGALLVTFLEFFFPHVKEWQGNRMDVKVDLLYMIGVQVAVPTILGLSLVLYLKNQLEQVGLQATTLWPHHWPLGFQVIFMLLMADFLRYWLHVASHRYEPLWRLHAVHHSPHKLYWLNVGRFHPIEKTLQYLFDALPFILLGVGEHVLALYFVFYAINGFFQHSNVELRFGLLNYLISSAELHRWHHSWLARESNSNYGNNLIVWDLLFGTRFLPDNRQVETLGLPNRLYPLTFFEQLKSPMIKGMEHRDAPRLSWYDLGINFLIRIRMFRLKITKWRTLKKAAQHPEVIQQNVLLSIIRENQDTQFGKDHQFQHIKNYHDYEQSVPIQSFEMLRPYIEKQDATRTAQLTKDQPVMYAQTSGTTGSSKFIPLLKRSLYQHKKTQNLISFLHYQEVPDAYSGKFLAIVSPAIEGYLDSGTPYGSISGSFYKNLPIYLKAKYVLPAAIFDISDYETKYTLIVRVALAQKNITAMGSANPSTFLKLLTVLNHNRQALLTDVKNETFSQLNSLPSPLREEIRPYLECSQERKAELETILSHDHITFRDLWPYLRLVSTWTGGSCGIAVEKVRAALPEHTKVGELGYLSSEFRGSIPIDLKTNGCLPTLTENFFELVEKEKWENNQLECLQLHQLERGKDYYVFITTPSGLYRYSMNDIIRVTGHFYSTPTIQFIQKGKGVTNITGEKLYESQVIQAITLAEHELSFTSSFFILLADPEQALYRLLIELDQPIHHESSRLGKTLEDHLQAINIEYAQKRASGRLQPLQVVMLQKGSGEAYKVFCLENGQREGQFKTLLLQYQQDFTFPYHHYIR